MTPTWMLWWSDAWPAACYGSSMPQQECLRLFLTTVLSLYFIDTITKCMHAPCKNQTTQRILLPAWQRTTSSSTRLADPWAAPRCP